MLVEDNAFGRLIDAARQAVDRTGPTQTAFMLAGQAVRLVGAGSALHDRVAPAFAHLPAVPDETPADLTVMLWDTASTSVGLPDLGEAAPSVGAPVSPILHDAGQSFVFHAFENAISYLDHRAGVGVYAVEDAATVPPWERACPLRALLTWWFAPQGKLLAHGAAVGGPEGATLMVGPGGSGKSTSALASFAAGTGYVGDDYVLLDPATRTVWSVYGSAKLAPDHLARFPGLLEPEPIRPGDPPDAKRIGWPGTARPDAIVLSAPVRAIVVPVVTGAAACSLTPVASSRALMALAPLTMFQTPGDQRAAFRLSTRFVHGVPTYRLELGAGMERVPGLLTGVAERGVVST